MNRIASVMAMQTRDRGTWLLIPGSVLAAGFAIVLLIALFIHVLTRGGTETFTGALAVFFVVMLVGGIGSVGATYLFAVGFGARRRDYLLGTLATAVVACAGWALALGLLSLVEANVLEAWGVGLHFFDLPVFSDGAPLREFCWTPGPTCARADPSYLHGGLPLGQFWVYFVLMLFMSVLGLLLGSLYQRFGRTGIYVSLGIVWLLLSLFLLASIVWSWWGAIISWLAGQTAAGLVSWLVPIIVLFALGSYALLRKATG
jgi:hypothetical protein